jgi:hypothetical protein
MVKKLTLVIVLLVLVSSLAFSQVSLTLISGGYFEQNNSYEWKGTPLTGGLPPGDFTDTWRSFGIGVTKYVQGPKPIGFYSSTHVVIPIDLIRAYNGDTNYSIQDFRFGIDAINGVGTSFGKDKVGFVIAGGLHLSYNLFMTYPGSTESRFNFFDIGAGGGAHVYFMVNETVNIHLGTVWWYDWWQIRYSSGGSISDDYYFDGGWGYDVTIGVGFKLAPKPAE